MHAGYLLSFPDATTKNITKILTSDIIVQGHMNQIGKNYQSTQPKHDKEEWTITLKSHVAKKNNDLFHKVLDLNHTIYTDQTGKFNVRSIRGHNHMMITCCYDSNCILV